MLKNLKQIKCFDDEVLVKFKYELSVPCFEHFTFLTKTPIIFKKKFNNT